MIAVIFIDATVANITTDTYIDKASKKRGSIAALNEFIRIRILNLLDLKFLVQFQIMEKISFISWRIEFHY